MTDEAWISTVRLVRDLGNVEQLLPPGVTSILDIPHPLHDAIGLALLVCGWEDNLESHERPPKRIWLDGKALTDWFDNVKRERKREMEGKGRRDIEDGRDNEAAAQLVTG